MLKISVAMLAYNAEKYIHDAIMSIINQDYPGEIEIVVAYDEGTTDNTLEILDKIKESLPLNRKLLVFNHKHTTPFRARLYCLEKVTGDYVHMFDYDNIMPPNRISTVVLKHIKMSHAEFLFSNAKVVDSMGRDLGRFLTKIELPYNILKLIRGNYIDLNTMVISKSCLKRLKDAMTILNHKYFDWIFEDWLFALLGFKHCKVQYMNDTFIWYRIHESNITANLDVFTQLFNKERRLKTLVAFYTIERKTLTSLERKEFYKAFIKNSIFIDKTTIEYLNLNQIKILHYLSLLFYKLFS